MSDTAHPTVRVHRRMPFSAERVFDAWLDPALAARWLYATPNGEMLVAETDPRVGGHYTFTERRGDEDVRHTGEYLEIVRPTRLVFTLGVPQYSPNFDRITVEITPDGDGCYLELAHLTSPQWAQPVRGGWVNMLETLAGNLGDASVAVNRSHVTYTSANELRMTRLLPGPIERVWAYLVEGEKRAQWLASGPLDLHVGSAIHWKFRHQEISPEETPPEQFRQYHEVGHPMNGEVTRCEPPRLLSYLWNDEDTGIAAEVTFELTPKGKDVELQLTHRKLSIDRDELLSVSSGWHTHVAVLIAQLSGNTPPLFWRTFERLKEEYEQKAPGAKIDQS